LPAFSPRRLSLFLALAALAAALLALPSSAAAERFKLRPVSRHHGVVTFKVDRLRGGDVRFARLLAGGRRRRVSPSEIERAADHGLLTVRPPRPRRHGGASGTRLVITVDLPKSENALQGGGGAPAGSGATGGSPSGGGQSSGGGSTGSQTGGGSTGSQTGGGSTGSQAGGGTGNTDSQTGGGTGNTGSGSEPAATDSGTSGLTSGSCVPADGFFHADLWPCGSWRPYSDSSPFNQRIGLDAKLAGRSDAIMRVVNGYGAPGNLLAGVSGTEDDWDHPTYYARPTDPVFKLHCYESDWGRCDIEGMNVNIPDGAKPAAGGDGHMTVVDQASGWEYDLYKVRSKPQGGGTLELRWGGRTRIDGDGLGSDATAARFGNLAGIIRAQELEAGEIRHALFLTLPCGNDNFVYPAKKEGATCGGPDSPPMGTRFQLAMSDSQIAALNVPRWKKTVLTAMAHYGMYFGDTGGDTWTVQLESGATYTSFGRQDEMVKYAKSQGIDSYNGHYSLHLRDGVDYTKYLRVVDPCVAQHSC
jgi:hypothetical protein